MKTTWSTDAATSARMKRVGTSATAPELRVRAAVRILGVRYRAVLRSLPGAPDLGSKKLRWVIFVNGCFWHGHRDCARATIPRRNRQAWAAKIAANKSRDRRVVRELRRAGYSVLVIWECQTFDEELLARRLRSFFRRIDEATATPYEPIRGVSATRTPL